MEEGLTLQVEDLLQPKKDFPFDDYRFVYDVASRLHGVGTVPEIVLVGINGTGKSQLLEAIVGHPINIVGFSEDILSTHHCAFLTPHVERPSDPCLCIL